MEPTSSARSAPSQTLDAAMLRLNVGDTLHMRLAGGIDGTQYGVRYLGGLRGHSLMTTLPLVDGDPIWMRPGASYIFRTLSGMYVYAFTSKVLKARSKPYPYAHFAYPAMVQARQVRRAARVRLSLPALARRADGGAVAVTLRDLSLNGVLIESADHLGAVGDTLELELPIALDEVNKRMKLAATLRNCAGVSAEGCSPPLRAGLEFGRLGNDDLLLLHYFIDHQIARDAPPLVAG
jgi:hypothetical protein